MRRILAFAFVSLLAVSFVFAANSAIDVDTDLSKSGRTVYRIDWLSDDGDGSVSLPFTARAGRLIQIKFVPDGGGTQPDNLYDVTILDADSADILEAAGANLSQTVSTWNTSTARVFLDGGQYTFTVAAAGNAKGGIVYLYVE